MIPTVELQEKQIIAAEYWLDSITEELLFGGAKGGGKLLMLDENIPTPSGWTKNGDIKINDFVISADGTPVRVVGLSNIEEDDAYELFFSDGTSIIAGQSHLWKTMTFDERRKLERRNDKYRENRRSIRPSRSLQKKNWVAEENANRKYKYLPAPSGGIRTTKDIYLSLKVKGGINHSIDQHPPLSLPSVDLPIPPYTLGAWLGDGTSINSQITGIDEDIFKNIEKEGFQVTHHKNIKSHNISGLKLLLRGERILNNKHIPLLYLRSSYHQRLSLLQGVMDTDGWSDIDGSCAITLKDKVLFNDVVHLIRTFGIIVNTSIVEKTCVNNGKKGTYYNAKFVTSIPVFRLQRKLTRQNLSPNIRYTRRFIINAKYIGRKKMRCIQIENEDGMYLAGSQFIPTHNSYLGCFLIFGDALIYPDTSYFIARRDLNDLVKYTYPSIVEVFTKMGLSFPDYVTYNGQHNYFSLYNGSKVYFIDCKRLPSDPEYQRFGSLQFTRGWFEEIGQIDSMAIINLAAAVGRWKNSDYNLKRKILMTCNPNKGYAYTNFYLPQKNGSIPDYRKFVQALPTDNAYLTADYLNALGRLPEKEKQRLMFGEWEYDDDPTVLIDFEKISNLFTNDFALKGEKRIVADIARFGSDRAIITVWDGMRLIEYITFAISSTLIIKDAINALKTKHKIGSSNILVDEDGVGGGVADELKCKGFKNGSSPTNKMYFNLKCQCGYKLAELVKYIYIECDLPDSEIEMIRQELGMLKTYESDKDGKLRILPKEKIKEILGRSPDWLDVFIMRMYFELGIKESSPMVGFRSIG